jgi:hypothetical protein
MESPVARECNIVPNTEPLTIHGSAVTDRQLLQAISAGPVSGYRYVYEPTDPTKKASTLFLRFTLQASPVEPGVSGDARFMASDSGDVTSSTKSP